MVRHTDILPTPLAFQWDNGNQNKSWDKHHVSMQEAEEAFTDEQKILLHATSHSSKEKRYVLFGHTLLGRFLFIAFTVREECIRIISARDMHKKERAFYEEIFSTTTV